MQEAYFRDTKLGKYVSGLAEGGKWDATLIHFLSSKSVEERITFLHHVLEDTIFPGFETGEATDENQLLWYVNAFGEGLRDRHTVGMNASWNPGLFLREWTVYCQDFYLALSHHIKIEGNVGVLLLSTLVEYWFSSFPTEEEADEVFEFLVEAARESEVADKVISTQVRRDIYQDRGASKQFERALLILADENRWVRAHELMKAISARWQRSLESQEVIFLAKANSLFPALPSTPVQEALFDLARQIQKLDGMANLAIEAIQNDQILHDFEWRIQQLNLFPSSIVIGVEYPPGGNEGLAGFSSCYKEVLKGASQRIMEANIEERPPVTIIAFDGEMELGSFHLL
ncbi:MAG: hypothetical protein WC385_03335 [Candidatus Paceibacterota bacterium]|jgi:hypothetical protein